MNNDLPWLVLAVAATTSLSYAIRLRRIRSRRNDRVSVPPPDGNEGKGELELPRRLADEKGLVGLADEVEGR